ncbi:GNAT family N-acetyltransferase [Actinokineospora xionganensis]|uniref:GNAT family N-acetyltransferase n=1 Tax=Actinokineospora xionganensis TaxID=2684470 RepID=A0ABR7LFX4_9PSEU|nr:GNAT family N-acetyltransferase [Actinokineospora xionganensis]
MDPTSLETRCADAWPPLVSKPLGDWRLRACDGYTGRANSALAVGDPGIPVAQALEAVVGFADEQRIRPCVQVIVGSETESAVAAAGWSINLAHPKGAESSVLVSTQAVPGPAAVVAESPPAGWFELVVGATPSAAQRHLLTSGPRVGFASVHRDGSLVGAARGCVVDGYLHISVVEVAVSHRRQGIGRELLAGLDSWADVSRRVLQVGVGNSGALALYAGLGYSESHRYRYWIPA